MGQGPMCSKVTFSLPALPWQSALQTIHSNNYQHPLTVRILYTYTNYV
jgi:hypothetical protein